jgi:hypothetical protein
MDEQVKLDINYSGKALIDQLVITLAILYKEVLVSIERIPFTEVKFRVLNRF